MLFGQLLGSSVRDIIDQAMLGLSSNSLTPRSNNKKSTFPVSSDIRAFRSVYSVNIKRSSLLLQRLTLTLPMLKTAMDDGPRLGKFQLFELSTDSDCMRITLQS